MKTKHFMTSSFNVFPTDLNHGNTLFGGKLMAEIDCEASKVARSVLWGTICTHAVTKTFNTEFKSPARQADLVVMEADVVALGKTSITIQVDAYVWSGPDRRNWSKICTVNTVFVAIGPDGQKAEHFQTMDSVVEANRTLAELTEPSKDLVNLLRRETGCSTMDCKLAIMSKPHGTLNDWIEYLRTRASKF